jgi:hypothetical protein
MGAVVVGPDIFIFIVAILFVANPFSHSSTFTVLLNSIWKRFDVKPDPKKKTSKSDIG